MKLKFFASAILSLSLLAYALAQTSREGTTPASNAPAASRSDESQKMTITRSGARTPGRGPEANFTGNVSVEARR